MEASDDKPKVDVDLERAEDEALHARFRDRYMIFFGDHPEADWVMIGDTTEVIYGGGTDSQIPSETAYAEMEAWLEERVHLFGRPQEIGLDGANPFTAVAEFTLTGGTELPAEVVEFLETHNIPYYLIHTDGPQPVRLLTSTGIYEGSSILAILGSEEFQPQAS